MKIMEEVQEARHTELLLESQLDPVVEQELTVTMLMDLSTTDEAQQTNTAIVHHLRTEAAGPLLAEVNITSLKLRTARKETM